MVAARLAQITSWSPPEAKAADAVSGRTVKGSAMVAEAIQTFGDDDQRARFLPRITSGEWPAAGFSLSEPGAGSDLQFTLFQQDGMTDDAFEQELKAAPWAFGQRL